VTASSLAARAPACRLQILGIVRDNGDRFARPEMSTTLSHLAFFNPGDPVLDFLADLHKAVQSNGLVPTIDAWTAQLKRQTVVDSWLNTSTWPEAMAFLHSHGDVLRTREVFDELAQSEKPETRTRTAILRLAETLPLPKDWRSTCLSVSGP
jgi:hypothetical protein